jgi:hypothetical protein
LEDHFTVKTKSARFIFTLKDRSVAEESGVEREVIEELNRA